MSLDSPHPPQHRLVAYGQGRLPDAEADTIEVHLAGCTTCQQCVETAPDDAIVELVRGSFPAGHRATAAVTRTEYRDLTPFAKGGLGEVSIARDALVGRDVAVKRLLPQVGDSPLRRRRFLREAAITGRLEHPGIAPVYGIGEDESGQPCYAMRFVAGRTLLDAIRELHSAGPPSPVSVRPLLTRFAALCATVAYAHSRGVVHRDIKPANVAIGEFGETILLDWGLAQTEDGDTPDSQTEAEGSLERHDSFRTATGTVMGTPGFMSPEQAAGSRVGPTADVFSLGVTLRCILTGHASRDTPVASPLRALMAIANRAAAQEPPARYASALDLAADIEHWLADEPVTAFRDPPLAKLRRWVRRHQTTTAAAIGLLFTAAVSLAVGAALLGSEQRKTAKALEAESNERANAEAKQAETAAVLAYVDQHVFAAGRPKGRSGGQGREVKLADAVVAAGAAVETAFPGQPTTQARVRAMLGATLLNMGDAKSAEREFTIARRLYEEHRGPDDPVTLQTVSSLATSIRLQGRAKEAVELDELLVKRRKDLLGPDHPDTLRSVHNLANSYMAAGREDDALKMDQEAYERRLATLGPGHPDTIMSVAGLASDHFSLGQYEQARKFGQEAYERRLALHGPDHADTIIAMNNLGNALSGLKLHEDAMKLRQEVLVRMRANSGPDHADTLMAMNNVARSLSALERWQEALDMHRQVLALRRVKLSPDHPDTLISLYNIAESQLNMGRADVAMSEFDEILRLAEGKSVNPRLAPAILERQVRHFSGKKDAAACRVRAERWEKMMGDSGEFIAVAATLWAMTSRAQADGKADADRAMMWLEKAVAAGYQDLEELERNEDYSAIRGREDYKMLLQRIRERAKPK